MSPIGLIDIYPSVPRNTDPRAVPSSASSKLERLSRPGPASSLRLISEQSLAEGEARCHRSVSSISSNWHQIWLGQRVLTASWFSSLRRPVTVTVQVQVTCHGLEIISVSPSSIQSESSLVTCEEEKFVYCSLSRPIRVMMHAAARPGAGPLLFCGAGGFGAS